MKRNEAMLKTGYSKILWAVLVILLCAAPALRADETVYAGEKMDIDYPIIGTLWVYGTANLLPGASVEVFLMATDTSVVNIKGGTVGWWIDVAPGAQVTVYGTGFNLGEGEFTINGTVTGFYENGDPINLTFDCHPGATVTLAPPGVDIDIKPGSYPNAINLGSNGVIPVAILSSETFDATTVDPVSVELSGSGVAVRGKGKLLAHEEDVNGDGLLDLVVQVETENLDPESLQDGYAILTGLTTDGIEFTGSDSITIVPPE